MSDEFDVYTIGHSTQSYVQFVNHLLHAGVNAIVDVRSAPYSRRYPHFNRENLRDELQEDSIHYFFLGEELGGRPRERRFFCDGVADYEMMATSVAFHDGIDRVMIDKGTYRLALMCSEHNPLDCHRCLLVGRALKEKCVSVGHILGNGDIRSHADIEAELLKMAELSKSDMFVSPDARLAAAYKDRSQRVAYSESGRIAEQPAGYHRDATKRDDNRLHKNYRRAFFRSTAESGS